MAKKDVCNRNINIIKLLVKNFNARYQCGDLDAVREIVNDELEFIYKSGLLEMVERLYAATEDMRIKQRPYKMEGGAASSMVFYLLGITKANPLPPHHYCAQCGKIEFVRNSSVEDGFDLQEKRCLCGGVMFGDGHNLHSQLLWHNTKKTGAWENEIALVCDKNIWYSICRKHFNISMDEFKDVLINKRSNKVYWSKNLCIKRLVYSERNLINLDCDRKKAKKIWNTIWGNDSRIATQARKDLNPHNIYIGKQESFAKYIKIAGFEKGKWFKFSLRHFYTSKIDKTRYFSKKSLYMAKEEDEKEIEKKSWPLIVPLEELPVFYEEYYEKGIRQGLEESDAIELAIRARYGQLVSKDNDSEEDKKLGLLEKIVKFVGETGEVNNKREVLPELRGYKALGDNQGAFKVVWEKSICSLTSRADVIETICLYVMNIFNNIYTTDDNEGEYSAEQEYFREKNKSAFSYYRYTEARGDSFADELIQVNGEEMI